MLKKPFFTIAFISWMMFVTFSSLFSFSGIDTPGLEIPHLDKVVHFTFYFVACVLGVLFLRERTSGKITLKKALIIMLLVTIAFGILMEVLQYTLTTERTGDILDGLANTAGSFCGAVAMKFYFSRERSLKWKF
ncbi:VanZ family protein [Maribacter sp. 2308TA10-17]|uniref:VanZ family protein n=1 Tax=Maribacter sp. 2308TA10-17 TaxID=3386276 RepID=UPI0039BD1ADC